MKWHEGFFLVALTAQSAWSQQPADPVQERARIESERARVMATHASEEQACYQRFAVSGCLSEVRARRRVAMEALQQEENHIDDVERRRRGAEQLRQRDEKVQARIEDPSAEMRASQARRAYEEKQARARSKQNQASQRPAADEGATAAANADAQTPQSSPGADATSRSAARQAYEEKLKRLEERRQLRDKRLEEKKGKPDRHLPVPD